MKRLKLWLLTASLTVAVGTACDRDSDPTTVLEPTLNVAAVLAHPAPPGVVTVPSPLGPVSFWPFTGVNFSGTPQDPMNLVLVGDTDPLALRAALMFLNGDRTAFGFPDVFPFNCTWKDAIGGNQTSYAESAGWVGNGILLECGEYDPIRFHVRFFDAGDFTLGGAHFEVIIPGTTDHQVIHWEIGEQLVVADFVRTGLVDLSTSPTLSGPINPAPFKTIARVIYDGLPADLKALIGPPPDDPTANVPRPTDGEATILNLIGSFSTTRGIARQDFVIEFDQVIPKPFCASGPFDFLYVTGPVTLRQQVVMTKSGNLVSQFHANGMLEVTPINPLTGEFIGETFLAKVNEHHKNVVTDGVALVSQFQIQALLPPKGPFRGRLIVKLNVGPGSADHADLKVRCEP